MEKTCKFNKGNYFHCSTLSIYLCLCYSTFGSTGLLMDLVVNEKKKNEFKGGEIVLSLSVLVFHSD